MIKRKVFTIFISLVLLSNLIGFNFANAQGGDKLHSAVAEQYAAYVNSLGSVSSNDSAEVHYRHAIRGNGAFLNLDANNAFTKGMLRANLTKMAFVNAISAGADYMLKNNISVICLAGSSSNYSNNSNYYFHLFDSLDEEYIQSNNSPRLPYYTRATNPIAGFSPNEYDQMLRDVVGACRLRVALQRMDVNKDSVRIKATLIMMDDFDFNGTQNTGVSIGNWLDGKFIDRYSWKSSVSFELTLPNECGHYEHSGVYRWELIDGQLINVSGEGLDANPLTSKEVLSAEGDIRGYYYYSDKNIVLKNDRPWVVEFRIGGSNSFTIAATPSPNYTPHFYWTTQYISCLEAYNESYIKNDGTESQRRVCKQVQYNYEEQLWKDQHTYRIENRIAPDGSNMGWLLIDGVEICPLDDQWLRYVNSDSKNVMEFIGDNVPWFDTTDFSLSTFFTSGTPMTPKCNLEYVQIWENGIGENINYYSDYVTEANCTEGKKAIHLCHICGTEYGEEISPALGHTEELIPGFAPSCTTEGLSDGLRCSVCSVTTLSQTVLPPLGHSEETIIATPPSCTSEGLSEGKKCAVCLEIIIPQIPLHANGHSWNQGETTKFPSTSENGELSYTCTVCGETKIEEIGSIPLPEYSDINPESWFYEAVAWASSQGITSGTAPKLFSPFQTCTRAQAVTFLWRAAGSPAPESNENPFSDITEGIYYYDAVLWALENGITTGLSSDTFGPDESCNRGQIVTFLWRALGNMEQQNISSSFDDVSESMYFYEPILWAVEKCITNGISENSFAPYSSCTRSQIVAFLHRAYAN